MQEWEGVVTAVGSESFQADLYDITAGHSEANEETELPIEDIQPEDLLRLAPGATFRWVVGYHRSSGGVRTRGFRIHFREPSVIDDEEVIPDLIFAKQLDDKSAPTR